MLFRKNILASFLILISNSVAAITVENFEKSGDLEQQIFLMGVIEGVVSEYVALGTSQNVTPNFCVPDSVPIDHKLARAAMNEYIKDAKEDSDLQVAMVVVLGLEIKYPC
tara:strand:+ start:266 stop:595 length:330 start_codon:yes stop_codon:yes gene_type:complete